MTKEMIPRPLPVKARLHLALEENASLRARIAALEAQLAAAKDACNQSRLAFAGMVSVQSAINKLDALSPAPEASQEPIITAMFEVTENGITGSTTAPVKRVETQDDGSYTVIIDYWPSEAQQEPVAWRDISTAPKNGTMLILLVQPGSAENDGWTPFADSNEPYTTIGFNALSNTGDDEWQFAGWDWCQDCFTDGAGTVIGWLPFEAHSARSIRIASRMKTMTTDKDARITALEAQLAALEAQLAARTGAMKVKRSDILTKIALWADDEGMDLSMGQGNDLAGRILSALEPAPEASQEPESDSDFLARARDNAAVWASEFRKTALQLGYSDMDEEWLVGWFANAIENTEVVRREQWSRPAEQAVTEAVTQFRRTGCSDWYDGLPDHTDGGGPYETRVLYTRPSEQAVTEALVETLVQATREYTRKSLFIDEHRELIRAALKAAMEAKG